MRPTAAVALFAALLAFHVQRSHAQMCGDPDGSGACTVTDGVLALRAAADLASACALHTCDVDGSGTLTVTDGVVMLRAAARLEAAVRCPTGVTLDASFGDGGIVTTPLGHSDDPSLPIPGGKAVIVQPDGKIVVAGGAELGASQAFVVARYEADGALDRAFGGTGVVLTPIGTRSDARGVALQADGKIVVAGSANLANTFSRVVALARYGTDGSLDLGFGEAGIVTTSVGFYDEANAVVVQPDGTIVVAGFSDLGFLWARYEADGTPDAMFGDGGTVIDSSRTGPLRAVAWQSDGKLVAAGASPTTPSRSDVTLARVDATGAVDEAFQPATIALGESSQAYAVAVTRDDAIVTLGTVATYGDAGTDFHPVFLRHLADGRRDPAFGDAGVAMPPRAALHWASAMVVGPDERMVAGGFSVNAGRLLFAVGRYRADGTVDVEFGGGTITTDLGANAQVNALARQPDGKIVAAGSTLDRDGQLSLAIVRYVVP